MNQAQLWSTFRLIVVSLGSGLAAKYGITNADFASGVDLFIAAASAVIAFGTAAYGVWKKRPAGVIQSAADLPNVAQIVTDHATANVVPSPKVIGG